MVYTPKVLTPKQESAKRKLLEKVYTPKQIQQQKKVEETFNLPEKNRIWTPPSGIPSRSSGGGGGGGGSSPMSTKETPTPSAETLKGSVQETEQQIKQLQKEQAIEKQKKTIEFKSKQQIEPPHSVISKWETPNKQELTQAWEEGYGKESWRPATKKEFQKAGFSDEFLIKRGGTIEEEVTRQQIKKFQEEQRRKEFLKKLNLPKTENALTRAIPLPVSTKETPTPSAETLTGKKDKTKIPYQIGERVTIGELADYELKNVNVQIDQRVNTLSREEVSKIKPLYNKEIKEKESQLQSRLKEKASNLQEKINKNKMSLADAESEYENFSNAINNEFKRFQEEKGEKFSKEIQEKTLNKIKGDENLKSLEKKYGEVTKRYGVDKDIYGKEVITSLEKSKIDIRREDEERKLMYVASFTPQTSLLVLAAAAKEEQVNRSPFFPTKSTPKEIELLTLGTLGVASGAISGLASASKYEKAIQKASEKFIKKQTTYEGLKRLGVGTKTKTKLVGALEKKPIQLSDIKVLTEKGSLGEATRFNIKNLKPESRKIVTLSKSIDKEGKDIYLSFKTTKTGKIKTPRVLVEDLSKGESALYRPAQPKELSKVFYKGVEPPIKIEEIERFKQIKGFKKLGKSQIKDMPLNEEKILRQIEKEGLIFQTEGKGKDTLSFKELQELPRTIRASTKIKPKLVSKTKSKEYQILKKSEDGISGLTYEEGISEDVPPLIEYDILNERLPKKITPDLEPLKKLTKKPKEEFSVLKDIDKKSKSKTKPSYVGGEGGQLSESEYQFERTMNKEFNIGFSPEEMGFVELTSPKFKSPTIKDSLVLKPKIISPLYQEITSTLKPSSKLKFNELMKSKELITPQIKITPKSDSILKQSPILNTAQASRSMQKLKSKQTLKPMQISESLVEQPIRENYRDTPLRFDIPFIPLGGKLPKGRLPIDYKPSKRTKKSEAHYTSSLVSATLNLKKEISEKDLKKIQEKVFTGGEIRPLLKVVSKKKKKNKIEY